MTHSEDPGATSKETPHTVADILAALGDLMQGLHKQDLVLQDAVSKLAASSKIGAEVAPIQHIDLITQTHDDLSRFLPILAEALSQSNFDEEKLAKILRLQSLRDTLLKKDASTAISERESGELSLF